MINQLRGIIADINPEEIISMDWNSIDVDYYPPRVERLWLQLGKDRLYLHKIHKTDKPVNYRITAKSSIIYSISFYLDIHIQS